MFINILCILMFKLYVNKRTFKQDFNKNITRENSSILNIHDIKRHFAKT